MALTKRTYVDGTTVITAQNLNDIQDEIIAQGNEKAEYDQVVSSITYDQTQHKFTKAVGGISSTLATLGSIIDLDITQVTS